ncbi:MAG: proteasome accessory factor PafA2 family protein, partial [Candidatus Sungbacteria bacterium]|nr:proteasome accessory factor PafA2 family protein [Candidatus Sungbacteria bacterium]
MIIPDRVYGIENEFGIILQMSDGTWDDEKHYLIRKMNSAAPGSMRAVAGPAKIWQSNGACIYIDVGEHPEHATPECLLVKDAVLYAKAGEVITTGIFSRRFPDQSRFILFKNNLGCTEEGDAHISYGCHENYLMHGKRFREKNITDVAMVTDFIPFLITRQIMDGAGWWQEDGTFLLSQRSLMMTTEIGESTQQNRPILHLKTTNYDTGPHHRLHLILGDSNILDVACFLKIGTTSLVLSLIESGLAPKISYEDPVSLIKKIARDDAREIQDMCVDGTPVSAYDVQVMYCEAARRMLASSTFASSKTEADLKNVLKLWEQSLNAIYAHDEEWMRGRFDYATKRFLANRQISRMRISTDSERQSIRKSIDLFYHNITDRTLQERMNKAWANRRIITDKQIEKAIYFPPAGTRARMRGLFVASLLDIQHKIFSSIEWINMGDATSIDRYENYWMNNPLEEVSEGFKEFFLAFLDKPRGMIYSP